MGVTSNRSYFKTLAFLNDLRFNTKSYIVLKLKGLNLRLFPQHIAYVVGLQMMYIGNIQNNFHQSSTVTSYYNHTIRAMFPLHQFLGVIIMKKRCSIQQVDKNNCSSEQKILKNWLFRF